MVSLGFSSKGWVFILLNVIRAINIIVLAIIAVSSAVLMVVAKMPDAYTFFADISLAFVIATCFFLGITEIGVCGAFVKKNWPAFGSDRGLTWLGGAMLLMGSHTLGELSDARNTKDSMGVIFWNVCMAGGILALIFGFVNIFTSWFFGSRTGQNARQLRSSGAATSSQSKDQYSNFSGDSIPDKRGRSWLPFGGNSKKPQISGPIHHHHNDMEKGHPMQDRGSPLAPAIQRPPTLQHPAIRRPSTEYSVASGHF